MEERVHILRYGTNADQKSILKAISTFDYLAINANMVAHTGSAVARFVGRELKKKYFIDPLTYAFQGNIELLYAKPKKGEELQQDNKRHFKTSITKLVEKYSVFQSVLQENRPITLDELETEEVQKLLCEEVMDFQMFALQEALQKDEMIEYLQYEKDENAENIIESLKPVWVIAPYFYTGSIIDGWLELNISLCKKMCELNAQKGINKPIMAQILLSREMLESQEAICEIAKKYRDLPCDGYLIWVDGLEETQCGDSELSGLMQLLKNLGDKPKYNMYGSFFSVMLTNPEIGLLNGVAHGLEYGESRKAYPVGGGIPSSKYYFLPLHQRLSFQDAFNLLKEIGVIDTSEENWGELERYFGEICGCPKCKEIMKEGMIDFSKFQSTGFYEVTYKTHVSRRTKADSETKENCRLHYLACKRYEFVFTERKAKEALVKELCEADKKYRSVVEKRIQVDYLEQWSRILKSESR